MKTLLIFLLIVACAVLYFHDKQQTADLTKAQADLDTAQTQNSDLTTKVNNLQSQVTQLQARLQEASAASAFQTQQHAPPAKQPPPASNSPFGNSGGLQGGALDRGSYKN